MKICLLTTNPNPHDDRIYYKLARSLNKIASVFIINPRVSSTKNDGIAIVGNDTLSKLKNSSWIFEQLKKIKPDIIQVTEPQLLPPAVKYKSKYTIKVIYDPAEDWSAMYREFSRKPAPIPQLLGFGMRQFENWFLNKIDYFIASDDWLYDYYESVGPCTLIYNYPNKDIFTFNHDAIDQRPHSCVHHGQLRKERGLFLMIETMKLVVEKYPDAYLDLVGRFSYTSEEELSHKLIEKYKLMDNVTISAPIPHTEIPHRIAQNTVGLLPFHNIDKFRNNIVIKMFEYSACKLPIVSFDLPPSRKYIENVQCGICVEPDSYHALAEGIMYMFENKEKYSLYKLNGYNAFVEKYFWEAQEKELFNIYTTLQ
ncbi:MAG: glycosyltransferase family 4 protein [Candidatus Marinimicrobia bacterium]|nr:glycosyltransferase family 4 protein [Candidatus Neomarinimicrobiota bacterium]MCH7762345.1 glycosyltransferase family 4 protein [Candidatus Neomarinimicrobiota bacterium]